MIQKNKILATIAIIAVYIFIPPFINNYIAGDSYCNPLISLLPTKVGLVMMIVSQIGLLVFLLIYRKLFFTPNLLTALFILIMFFSFFALAFKFDGVDFQHICTYSKYSSGDTASYIKSIADKIYIDENSYNNLNCDNKFFFYKGNKNNPCVGRNLIFHSSQNSYCAYWKDVYEEKDTYYCLDNNKEVKTVINPGTTGYCNGITFICPPKN